MNWGRLLERARHPMVELVWHLSTVNQTLRRDLDDTRHDLAVSQQRETRWRRHATFASEGNPEAERRVAFQLWSDEWADAPEIEDRDRNTRPMFPRSLP